MATLTKADREIVSEGDEAKLKGLIRDKLGLADRVIANRLHHLAQEAAQGDEVTRLEDTELRDLHAWLELHRGVVPVHDVPDFDRFKREVGEGRTRIGVITKRLRDAHGKYIEVRKDLQRIGTEVAASTVTLAEFAPKIEAEIEAAAAGEGQAVAKRTEMTKAAEANKAFAHFRW